MEKSRKIRRRLVEIFRRATPLLCAVLVCFACVMPAMAADDSGEYSLSGLWVFNEVVDSSTLRSLIYDNGSSSCNFSFQFYSPTYKCVADGTGIDLDSASSRDYNLRFCSNGCGSPRAITKVAFEKFVSADCMGGVPYVGAEVEFHFDFKGFLQSVTIQ